MTDAPMKVAVPVTVKASVALLVAGQVLSLVTYRTPPISSQPTAVIIVGGIIGLAIFAFLVYNVYRGRNWVRILLSVLASVGTVLVIVDLISGAIGYSWLEFLGQVVSDVSVILLWVAPSRQYFSAMKQARRLAAPNEPNEPASRI